MVTPIAPTIPGLSAAQARAYTTTLAGDCEIRFRITHLTLSHQVRGSLETQFVDGQINVVDDHVARTLQLGVLDPDHALLLDGATPVSGVGGLDRLLQIHTRVRGAGTGWLTAPAGTFRPGGVQRDGDVVTLEGLSKECLHLNTVGAYSIPKRTPVVTAIRQILGRNGETRFRFPSNRRELLPDVVHVGGGDDARMPWLVASRLASSLGLHLRYDLLGYACLEPHPSSPAWRLVEADDPTTGGAGNTLSRIQVSTDLGSIRNRVIVTGRTKATKRAKGRPAVKSKQLIATATADRAHPLSPWSLAVNGTPWVDALIEDKPDIHTQAALNRYAAQRLQDLLTQQSRVTTSTFPLWHLRRMDMLELAPAAGGPFTFRLTESSIPLGPSAEGMSVGFTRTVRRATAGRFARRA